jgi:hypothetical protein
MSKDRIRAVLACLRVIAAAPDVCAKGDMSPNHELVRTVLTSLAALYTDQGRGEDASRIKRGELGAARRP